MKKFISLLLSLVLSLCAAATAIAADTSSVEYKLIRTAEELAAISGSGSYMLANDIDLTGYDWKGISSFSGTLNGGNYSIINLKSDSCGLFNRLGAGAKIENIRLKNASIVSTRLWLGGIAAYIPSSAKNVSITNCAVYGEIISLYNQNGITAACGGVVGFVNSYDTEISGCVYGADVQGNKSVGGIVGINRGKLTDSVSAAALSCSSNNHNYCNCPYEEENGVITQSHTLVDYSCRYMGGIAGINYGKISDCVVCADSRFDEAVTAGLVCAANIKNRGVISDCLIVPKTLYSNIPKYN